MVKRIASIAFGAFVLAAALACGGGDGLFSQPDRAWDVRLGFVSENPPGCGHDVATSLRGDVHIDGGSIEIVVYFEDTETCEGGAGSAGLGQSVRALRPRPCYAATKCSTDAATSSRPPRAIQTRPAPSRASSRTHDRNIATNPRP